MKKREKLLRDIEKSRQIVRMQKIKQVQQKQTTKQLQPLIDPLTKALTFQQIHNDGNF